MGLRSLEEKSVRDAQRGGKVIRNTERSIHHSENKAGCKALGAWRRSGGRMDVSAPWDLWLRGNIGESQVKHFLVDCLGFLGIKLPVRFRVLRIKHSDETMKIKRIYGTGRTQTI